MRWFLRAGCAVATICCGAGAMAQTGVVPIDPGSWITADDYPPSAMHLGQSGTVAVQLSVDATGKAVRCTVTTSASAALDARTCEVMLLRARFVPATDAKGRPIASLVARRVNWALPQPTVVAWRPFWQSNRIVIGKDGIVRSCTTDRSEAIEGQVDFCLLPNRQSPMFDYFRSRYKGGTVTILVRQDVEGVSPKGIDAAATTGAVPPFRIIREEFSVDPAGKLIECTGRASDGSAQRCMVSGPFQPAPGTAVRRGTLVTSFVFQPDD